MDSTLKQKIKEHYRGEYQNCAIAAAEQKPGFWNKALRKTIKAEGKYHLTTVYCLVKGGVFGFAFGGVAGALICGPAYAASNIATFAIIDKVRKKYAHKAAEKALEKDIADGTLTARYQAEALNKEQDALTAAIVSPSESLTEQDLAAIFTAAAEQDNNPAAASPVVSPRYRI